MNILKSAGKGLLYILCSPFILAFFALFIVYSIILFFIEWIMAIIQFFKGGKFTLRTKEDDILDQMIAEKQNQSEEPQQAGYQTTNNTTNQTINNIYIDSKALEALNKMGAMNNLQNTQQINNPDYNQIENNNNIQIEMNDSVIEEQKVIEHINEEENK